MSFLTLVISAGKQKEQFRDAEQNAQGKQHFFIVKSPHSSTYLKVPHKIACAHVTFQHVFCQIQFDHCSREKQAHS